MGPRQPKKLTQGHTKPGFQPAHSLLPRKRMNFVMKMQQWWEPTPVGLLLCALWLNPYQCPMRQACHSPPPFYSWGNWGSESGWHVLEITEWWVGYRDSSPGLADLIDQVMNFWAKGRMVLSVWGPYMLTTFIVSTRPDSDQLKGLMTGLETHSSFPRGFSLRL